MAPSSTIKSPYLVHRLLNTGDENLFNFVKFRLIKAALFKHCPHDFSPTDQAPKADDRAKPHSPPVLLDLGCGNRACERYLRQLDLSFRYVGIDHEYVFEPHIVCNLLDLADAPAVQQLDAPALTLLDVLEHLHEDPEVLTDFLGVCARMMAPEAVMLVTLPQMYRLDRFKLPHLSYPEHKIRLTQSEWRALFEVHFDIIDVCGVGYLSALPFLPMFSKHYRPHNALGQATRLLRGKIMEWDPFKPLDLWLSNTLGRHPVWRELANDFLLVVRPKKAIHP